MLYAAGYNTVTDNHSLDLSPELEDVITAMTVDEYDDRATLEYVLEQCDTQLQDTSSEEICGQLADIEKLDTSVQGRFTTKNNKYSAFYLSITEW